MVIIRLIAVLKSFWTSCSSTRCSPCVWVGNSGNPLIYFALTLQIMWTVGEVLWAATRRMMCLWKIIRVILSENLDQGPNNNRCCWIIYFRFFWINEVDTGGANNLYNQNNRTCITVLEWKYHGVIVYIIDMSEGIMYE